MLSPTSNNHFTFYHGMHGKYVQGVKKSSQQTLQPIPVYYNWQLAKQISSALFIANAGWMYKF